MGRMTIRVEGEPQRHDQRQRRGIQAAEVPGDARCPQDGRQAGRQGRACQGKATAYTGAAIDGAKVRYRVVREVRYPDWWCWCYWWRTPADRQPGDRPRHGDHRRPTARSPSSSSAKPDLSVPEKDEPTFHFTVYADVTDTAGETRSAQRSVNVGYTALQAVDVRATSGSPTRSRSRSPSRTQTLDGEGQKADGTVKVYRLKQPEKVQRASLSARLLIPMPHAPRRGRRAAASRPAEPKPDLSNPNSWELGEVVAEEGFTTDAAGKAS